MEPMEVDEDDKDSESLDDDQLEEQSDAGFEEEEEEIPNKKRRGKSQAQKKHNAAHDFSVVSAKLSSILRGDLPPETKTSIVETLGTTAYALSEISQRARMLSDYHLLRCLDEDLPLPDVTSQSYYKACCTHVTGGRSSYSASMSESYEKMKNRFSNDIRVPSSEHRDGFMDNLARQMNVDAKNHLSLNFERNAKNYIKSRYDKNAKEADKILKKLEGFVPEGVDEDNPDHAMLGELYSEFGKVFPVNYKEILKKENIGDYLKKSFRMLTYMEGLPLDQAGRKTFSLLPLKNGFSIDFVTISRQQICLFYQMLPMQIRQASLNAMLSHQDCSESDKTLLAKVLERRKVAIGRELMQNGWICDRLWNYLFDVTSYETSNRKFAYQVSTDGYGVSISCQKPNDGSAPKQRFQKKNRFQRKEEEIAKEFDQLPHAAKLKAMTHFIGIDPGQTYVVTAFAGREAEVPRIGGNQPTVPTTGSGTSLPGKKPKIKSEVIQISTKEFRHLSKTNEFQAWEKRLRARDEEYSTKIKDLPSLKTARPNVFLDNMVTILGRSAWLFDFHVVKPFRKWTFKKKVYQQKALHQAYKRIVPKQHRKSTLIGFGDWSAQDGLKGNPKAPVKKIRRALREKGVPVVRIDEYRTSKTCSHCQCEENVFQVKHNQDRFNRKKREKEFGLFETHEVVRCKNCMKSWQRDINASRNIHHLLQCLVQGKERPKGMRRVDKDDSAASSKKRKSNKRLKAGSGHREDGRVKRTRQRIQ